MHSLESTEFKIAMMQAPKAIGMPIISRSLTILAVESVGPSLYWAPGETTSAVYGAARLL